MLQSLVTNHTADFVSILENCIVPVPVQAL